MLQSIWFEKHNDSSHKNCTIHDVTYTRNITDTENMVECDCGKNCISEEGMCIRIYLSYQGSDVVMAGDNLMKPIYDCTFQEKKCKGVRRADALENTHNHAMEYISLKNINKTIECYSLNDQIYLSNSFDINRYIIMACVFAVLLILCGITTTYTWIRENHDDGVCVKTTYRPEC